MKIGLPNFHWGEKPVEEKPPVDQNKVLHDPDYVVMKMGSGEISDPDQSYIAEHLDEMLVDERLQECWSRVHIGQPIFQYKAKLRAVAAEWSRTHPTPTTRPPFTIQGKFVAIPTPTGVEVYKVIKWKNKGKPDETADIGNEDPWLTFPSTCNEAEVRMRVSEQIREDKQRDASQAIRRILSGAVKE